MFGKNAKVDLELNRDVEQLIKTGGKEKLLPIVQATVRWRNTGSPACTIGMIFSLPPVLMSFSTSRLSSRSTFELCPNMGHISLRALTG